MKTTTKKIVIALIIFTVLLLMTACNEEKKTAKLAYESECERINTEISTLNKIITECESLIKAAEVPYDPSTLTTLETNTTLAKSSITEIEKCPYKAEEINKLVEELSNISYVATRDALIETKKEYENSVSIMKQITNPSEAFVVNRIKNVPGIIACDVATEDNDPNEQLGKAGGYTAAVYFAYEKVNQQEVLGTTLLEKGTDAGGQIEVYANVGDAERRNTYLAAFDGGILSSGSHSVIGTLVVRTSDYLKASEQRELEANLIAELTRLDDSSC